MVSARPAWRYSEAGKGRAHCWRAAGRPVCGAPLAPGATAPCDDDCPGCDRCRGSLCRRCLRVLADGDNPARWEAKFLEFLGILPHVGTAASAAGVSRQTAYKRRDQSPRFAAAWDAARESAIGALEQKAWQLALEDESETMIKWLLPRLAPERWGERVAQGENVKQNWRN